jgi:tetratricopeptide (TPR) repeat protein
MSLFLLQGHRSNGYFRQMSRFLILASVFLGVTLGLSALAQEGEAWQESKVLFDAGKIEEALQKIKAHPSESASYYYNVGTLLFRSGLNGPAVAHLEKAYRLSPSDPQIRHNLEIARNSLIRLIGAEKLDPASTWDEKLADRLSRADARFLAAMFGLSSAIAWILSFLRVRSLRSTLTRPAGLFGVTGLIILSLSLGAQRLAQTRPSATCVEQTVVRSGPGDSYLEIGRLEAGSNLRLLTMTDLATPNAGPGGWIQIRHTKGDIGWVRSSSLLLL